MPIPPNKDRPALRSASRHGVLAQRLRDRAAPSASGLMVEGVDHPIAEKCMIGTRRIKLRVRTVAAVRAIERFRDAASNARAEVVFASEARKRAGKAGVGYCGIGHGAFRIL